MTFGETVKSLRESKNLTQKQLGERIGISRPTINLWERGKVKPTKPEIIEKLANALGVTVKDLIGDEVVSIKEEKAAPKANAPKKKVTIIKPKKAVAKVVAVGDAEKEPITSTEIPTESITSTEMTPSAEAISLATRLAILLPELSSSEKDAVMVSLNAAYWRSR